MSSRVVLILALAELLSVSCVAQQTSARVAHVALAERASVRFQQIQLGDIANITASNAALKRRLAELEIGDVPSDVFGVTLKKSKISILIRLNGIPREQFELDGPDSIRVEYNPPAALTDADVEQAAEATFLEVLGGKPEDLRVRLSGPFLASVARGIRDRKGLRVEVMAPLRGRLGKISTTIRLWDGKQLAASRPASFEVQKRQHVAVVLTSLRRDETINQRNVRLEKRFVAEFRDQPQEEDFLGKVARRDLQPGQVLSLADLKSAPRQSAVIAVRARETIEVEAVSGALRVRLQAATAMQSGRVGDVIQFKNPDSGHTRAGKIIGPGRVQVKL